MAELKCSDGTIVQISTETENELRAACGPKPKPKFGDIVQCEWGRRVVLYDKTGTLMAYRRIESNDFIADVSPLSMYTPTGKNIFTNDLLNLKN